MTYKFIHLYWGEGGGVLTTRMWLLRRAFYQKLIVPQPVKKFRVFDCVLQNVRGDCYLISRFLTLYKLNDATYKQERIFFLRI